MNNVQASHCVLFFCGQLLIQFTYILQRYAIIAQEITGFSQFHLSVPKDHGWLYHITQIIQVKYHSKTK